MVTSVTVAPAKDPRVVPAGSVKLMVLPADPSRAPDEDVVKPTVQVESAPAADEDAVADNDTTDWAVVIEIEAVAGVVSDVVDTDTVAGQVALGLVTPFRVTVTASPAATESPLEIRQVTVVPLATAQLEPTVWSAVVSTTVPPAKDPRVVPVGRVTEMLLPAAPSRSPEDDVVKPTVQVAGAPAADEDASTDGAATDWAVVIEVDADADLVSDVVDTDTVAGPVAVGLVTPFRATVTASPAATEYPL